MTTMELAGPQLRPPDGGWGWMVVFAYGMANIMIIPVLQSFGLIFKDTFQQINISATDASLIINLASAVGMTFGLFNGPLLRSYGFRKVAFLGGTMFSLGLMLTSSAETFAHFIITYSIIASLGMGFCNSSFSLALNTYFVARRNKAAGIAMTITGLGPILLPQLVSLLVSQFGSRNCLLIIGALATHIMAAALLLQPVKRHMIPVAPKTEPATPPMTVKPSAAVQVVKEPAEEVYSVVDALNPKSAAVAGADSSRWELDSDCEDDYLERQNFMDNYNIDAQSIYGFEQTTQPRHRDSLQVIPPPALQLSRARSEVLSFAQRRPSMAEMLTYKTYSQRTLEAVGKQLPESKRWFHSGSDESVNLESSLAIFDGGEKDVRRNTLDLREARKKRVRTLSETNSPPVTGKRWFESEDSVHLGSSVRIFDERGARPAVIPLQTIPQSKVAVVGEDQLRLPSIIRSSPGTADRSTSPKTAKFDLSQVDSAKRVPSPPQQQQPPNVKQTFLQKLVSIFDLTLLKDKVYVNMMLGMSIAVFAEINFSLLTPFILNDLGYHTEQIASVMSTLAMTDLLFRFVSPFVGDFLKLKPRVMYMVALTMLILTRFSILLARNYTEMLVVAFFLGVAKGVRTVYMGLVIPSYIPIKRLPAASSIQMMTNGIILMTIGPLVGLIRDLSGSYSKSILFINVFTMVTLVMWAVEMVYVRRKVRQKEEEVKAAEVMS